MKINKKRINSIKHLSILKENAKFTVKIEDVERFNEELSKFGFYENDKAGTTILPSNYCSYAAKNAEVYYSIDKTKPREPFCQTVYWTRKEWSGRGETRDVTEFSYITRKRYHRDAHMPYSVKFTLIEDKSGKSIQSDILVYSEKHYPLIMNTINMLLYLFGECSIVSDEFVVKSQNKIVNWDILPKGKYPWESVEKVIKNFKATKTRKEIMLRNCKKVNEYGPDFRVFGRSGFNGYVIFGFTDKNLYILESIVPNNATYVFQNDWENLAKLSKAEILNNKLQKQRIIHNGQWEQNFIALMEA